MKKLRIFVCLPTHDNDFQLEQASSAEHAAETLKIDLSLAYANNDAVAQSTQILKAMQVPRDSRPDAVIFEPVGSDALPRVAQAAREAGIGWAVLNREPEYIADYRIKSGPPIFSLSSDHTDIGRIQGRQFAALLPNGGTLLYIEGPSHSSSAKKRTAGMLETKPPSIQVRSLKGQWTTESAERAVRSWLSLATSHKAAVDLVGAQDDSMAMGARYAFEGIADAAVRDAWLKLPFTGCDGVPATGQAWVRSGLLAATVFIPPLAGQAIEMIANAISNGKEPPEHSTTTSISIPPVTTLHSWKH